MKSIILTAGLIFFSSANLRSERIIIHVVDDSGNYLSGVELKFVQAKQEDSTDDWGLSDKNVSCGKYENLDVLVSKKGYRVISPDTTNVLTIHKSTFNRIFRIVMKRIPERATLTFTAKGEVPTTYSFPTVGNANFQIQIKASSVEIPIEVLQRYGQIIGLSIFEHIEHGKPYPFRYRLHLDNFSKEKVSQTLNQVKALGFNDAFIVYSN